MLNCKITQGVAKECGFKSGGVKYIALANLKDIVVSPTNLSAGVIEASEITADANLKKGEKLFKVFEVADQTGVATSTVQVGGSKDAKSLLHTVGGQIIGLGEIEVDDPTDPTGEKKLYYPAMVGDEYVNFVLADVVALVRQADGKVVLFGYDNGMKSDNFDYTTGTSESDLNGITFQFSGTQHKSPIVIEGGNAAWATLIGIEGTKE